VSKLGSRAESEFLYSLHAVAAPRLLEQDSRGERALDEDETTCTYADCEEPEPTFVVST
jgi:hypothetical protein